MDRRQPVPIVPLIVFLVLSLAAASVRADVSPETAQREAHRLAMTLQRLLATDADRRDEAVDAALKGDVGFESLADHILGDTVERGCGDARGALGDGDYTILRTRARFDLEQALRTRLARDLRGLLDSLADARVELVDVRTAGDLVVATLALSPPGGAARRIEVRIDPTSGQVVDAEHSLGTISGHYRELLSGVRRQRLSPFVAVAQLRRLPYAVVEDFGDSPAGGLPFAWRWFEKNEDTHKPYRVVAAAGHRYLQAEDHGESVVLMKAAHWDPVEYPTMSWCWRADTLPPGGDERFDETNDSAAGVYVVFSKTWLRVPRQVKYVWSTTLPVGTVGRRDRWARPYFVVVESGRAHAGGWRLAHVDLPETYAATYGGAPAERTEGIGLLTDANSSGSVAKAAYADFRVWRRGAFDAAAAGAACGELP